MAKAYLRADSPYVWITFSHNDKRYRRKTKYLAKDLEIVEAQLPEFMRKVKAGEIVLEKVDAKLFDYYIELWIKTKQHLKHSSKRNYKGSYNYWLPIFQGREIESIKASEINNIMLDLQVGKEHKRNRFKHLKQVFQLAYMDDAIKENTCNKVKLSFAEEDNEDIVFPFSVEEVDLLLSKATGYFKTYLAIAFYTGARTGEIFAMKWHNVDFERKRIYIDATVGNYKEGTPKTKSSKRFVPIFDSLMPYLKEYKAKSGLKKYLFQTRTGKTFDSANLTKQRWKPLLNECRLQYRRLYQTRHTFATTMISSNYFNLNQIAKIMGHSNIQMLLLKYNKFIDSSKSMEIDTKIDVFVTKNVTKKIEGA